MPEYVVLLTSLGASVSQALVISRSFVTRFDGSDFEHWKARMHDALTQLGQVLPLQGRMLGESLCPMMSGRTWMSLHI